MHPYLWHALINNTFLSKEHEKVLLKLNNLGIETIFDVGANKGQFALASRIYCKSKKIKIYSFEPCIKSFKNLSKILKKLNFGEAFNIALGEIKEEKKLFHTNSLDNASMLVPSNNLFETYGIRNNQSFEFVKVNTLDNFINKKILSLSKTLLKIDVQGFELAVLRGALHSLPSIDYVYIEISFIEFYERQPLGHEVIKYLNEFGFEVLLKENCFFNKEGDLLQADYLFENKDKLRKTI